MTTTSTHDTKRGEDARARLAVLSERSDDWQRAVERWHQHHYYLDPNDEYHFYQALIAAYPFNGETAGLEDRLVAYMHKAAKEAKVHTSWVTPNSSYDKAIEGFVRGRFKCDAFMSDVHAFSESIGERAAANALGQVTLRLMSPGVPDTYNGCETWHQTLVDPDNRQPVTLRYEELGDPVSLWRNYKDGRIKGYVLQRLLHLRKKNRELFLQSNYEALDLNDGIIAFKRSDRITVLVSRFGTPITMKGNDVLAGQGQLPVAVLLT